MDLGESIVTTFVEFSGFLFVRNLTTFPRCVAPRADRQDLLRQKSLLGNLEEFPLGWNHDGADVAEIGVLPVVGKGVVDCAAAVAVLGAEATKHLRYGAAGLNALSQGLDDAADVDKCLVGRVIFTMVVIDEHSVEAIELDAVGGVVENDDTIHVATQEAEILGVHRLSEPEIVAEDDVVKDLALAFQLLHHWTTCLLGRGSPEDNLHTSELADCLKSIDAEGTEEGFRQVSAAVADQGLIEVEDNGEGGGAALMIDLLEKVALEQRPLGRGLVLEASRWLWLGYRELLAVAGT